MNQFFFFLKKFVPSLLLFFYWASIFNINHKVLCDDDAHPVNQVSIFIKRDGVFFGQCSELCGVNHGFMPIVVESVPIEKYIKWVLLHSVCNNCVSSLSTWFNNTITIQKYKINF